VICLSQGGPSLATDLLIGGSHGVVRFDATTLAVRAELLTLPFKGGGAQLVRVKDVAQDEAGNLYTVVADESESISFLFVNSSVVSACGTSVDNVAVENVDTLLVLDFLSPDLDPRVLRFDRTLETCVDVPPTLPPLPDSVDFEDIAVADGEALLLGNDSSQDPPEDSFLIFGGVKCSFGDPAFHAEAIAIEPDGTVLAGGYVPTDSTTAAAFERRDLDPLCGPSAAPTSPDYDSIDELAVDPSGTIFAVVSSGDTTALLEDGLAVSVPQEIELDAIAPVLAPEPGPWISSLVAAGAIAFVCPSRRPRRRSQGAAPGALRG
jgi:hypothetical protein